MKFLHRFQRKEKQTPTAYSLVDVGRDTVKAAVVLMIPGNHEPQVVGYGLAETGNRDITGGRNEAEAVAGPVNEALTQAEDSAERFIGQKVVPDDVVFAIAGRAVIGKLFTVEQTRPRPSVPITPKEMNGIRLRAERLIPQGLAEAAYEGGQWLPLAVTDAGMLLDGRLVMGGNGLTGSKIVFSVFGVAVQAGALRGLEVLAEKLDLSVANVVASPHALASIAPHTEAIILDIGFSGTDVCLIKNNALVATDWTPFGGYFFTHSLAQTMEIKLKAARTLKHAFANGSLLGDQANNAALHLKKPLRRWCSSVMEILAAFPGQGPLPRRIFLTGGAGRLPGFEKMLKMNLSPFEAVPEVKHIKRQSFTSIKNLADPFNYNLMALALSLTVGIPES